MVERFTLMWQRLVGCQREKMMRKELEKLKKVVDVSVERILNISKMFFSNTFSIPFNAKPPF
jgi:hypothetical protein